MIRGALVVMLAVALDGPVGPTPGRESQAGPVYALSAAIPLGLQELPDLDVDHWTGLVYLAFRDGLRIVDLRTGQVSPHHSHLEMSGHIELAPDINRIFAELDDDEVGFIDLWTLEIERAVSIRNPGRLVYEPATGELYVFSEREPRVVILDGRNGDQKDVIDLPGWGGDGILKTPGRIYVTSAPRQGLYVIETAERRLIELPMAKPLADLPRRFTLVADAAGRMLFARDGREVVAIDPKTGERVAVIRHDSPFLMYDDATEVLLAFMRESGSPGLTLVSYRLDGEELARVSGQRLQQVIPNPFPTASGLVSMYHTSRDGPLGLPVKGRLTLNIWQRARR